jgi:short-subunit dehydrogenase
MTTVLITGVTDGIGRALAQHYASAGVFPPAAYCQIDRAQPDAGRVVANFLDALGIDQLDVLIHNSAAGWYGPVVEQPAACIDELLSVNLRAPVALTHALLPQLAAARRRRLHVHPPHHDGALRRPRPGEVEGAAG